MTTPSFSAGPTAGLGASSASSWTAADELNAAAASAGDMVSAAYADNAQWGGDYFDGTQLVVNIVGEPPANLQGVLTSISARTGVPITVAAVDHTEKELENIVSTLSAQDTSLRAQGVGLVSWGVLPQDNAVTVGLKDPTASQVTAVQNAIASAASSNEAAPMAVGTATPATAAAAPVLFEQVPGVTQPTDRYYDGPPWIGGDFTKNTNYDNSGTLDCTTGFSAKRVSDGQAVMIMAGHCFASTGITVSNGLNTLGPVIDRIYGNIDAGVVQVDSNDDNVWSDPTSSSRDITGASTADTIGVRVCYDGYVTRESCGSNINGQGFCINYDSESPKGPPAAKVCGLVRTSGGHAIPGDSGGPVYTTTGSGYANATGIISGLSGTTWNYYTPIWRITNLWGLKVKCGTNCA